MKKKLTVRMLCVLFFITVISSVYSASAVKSGDAVFAEWVPNGWYHGTVGESCGLNSFTINFDDGDVKCCTLDKIVKDALPSKAVVSPGKKVLAQWSDGRYYPGKVSVVNDGRYQINFDDGDRGEVDISQIRVFD